MKNLFSDEACLLVRNPRLLALARRRCLENDPCLRPAVKKLRSDILQALDSGPFTVVEKKTAPPSGDKHDYVSAGSYWWPNPDTPDGLPYIRRDGEKNPEIDDYDTPRLSAMVETVGVLSLGWFFFEDRACAQRAVELLRVFFLNAATRMNPNLEFGQFIPGQCSGRGFGIIDTVGLATDLIDSIGILRSSSRLRPEDVEGLKSWFSRYLDWLLESSHGSDERRQPNNHGTAYDLQVAVFSRFVGREQLTREVISSVKKQRILSQIETDGRQPRELARTRAFCYSALNLHLLFCFAGVAEKLKMDLWGFESEDGRSIRRALDWLVPFWTREQSWPYRQIEPFSHRRSFEILRRAAWAYGDIAYENALKKLPLDEDTAISMRTNLFYPPALLSKTAP